MQHKITKTKWTQKWKIVGLKVKRMLINLSGLYEHDLDHEQISDGQRKDGQTDHYVIINTGTGFFPHDCSS